MMLVSSQGPSGRHSRRARNVRFTPRSGHWLHHGVQIVIVIVNCFRHYYKQRPHSSLGCRPPAPEVQRWQAKPVSSGTPPITPDPSSTTALELTFQLDHRLRAGHHPLLTQKVIAGIHWEALRLWSKGLKVRSRPSGR